MVRFNQRFLLDLNFLSFFSFIEIWGCLTHFSITNLLRIYDYMLNKWVKCWHF